MKRRFLRFVIAFFLAANIALAAVPKWIGDRIVDKIMDFGDKHIHGPFKKGGGDEAATRNVISDIVMPTKWWRAAWDALKESSTASEEQDKPGYSQAHGVPLPTAVRSPNGQPNQPGSKASPAPQAAPPQSSATQAPTMVNRDHAAVTPEGAMPESKVPAPGESAPVVPETKADDNSTPEARNDSTARSQEAPPESVWIGAGQDTWAQPHQPVVILNPELATGGGDSTPATPNRPSPAPSPVPSPTPATQSSAPAAPSSAPRDKIGPPIDHHDRITDHDWVGPDHPSNSDKA